MGRKPNYRLALQSWRRDDFGHLHGQSSQIIQPWRQIKVRRFPLQLPTPISLHTLEENISGATRIWKICTIQSWTFSLSVDLACVVEDTWHRSLAVSGTRRIDSVFSLLLRTAPSGKHFFIYSSRFHFILQRFVVFDLFLMLNLCVEHHLILHLWFNIWRTCGRLWDAKVFRTNMEVIVCRSTSGHRTQMAVTSAGFSVDGKLVVGGEWWRSRLFAHNFLARLDGALCAWNYSMPYLKPTLVFAPSTLTPPPSATRTSPKHTSQEQKHPESHSLKMDSRWLHVVVTILWRVIWI